jgi:hypothetical protein
MPGIMPARPHSRDANVAEERVAALAGQKRR